MGGFTLQIDCPDLAMGRHTQFQTMNDREFIEENKNLIKYLNLAVEGIPKEKIRVHICWGNYGFSHHRDIALEKFIDNLNLIHCNELLIENANPRHNHEVAVMGRIRSANICLGCIDTSSPHVENPKLVAKRLTELAQQIGVERVRAGTDCGFATTADGQNNTEIVSMKFRSLVLGARIASSTLFPTVSKLFVPRKRARVYWFGGDCSLDQVRPMLETIEVRPVPEGVDASAIANHMKSYVDLPVFFCGAASQSPRSQQVLELLAGTAAYPLGVLGTKTGQALMDEVKPFFEFDMTALKMEARYYNNAGNTPNDTYDVVVVGAGITGLYTAKALQDAGVNVCLLEKSDAIGGIWNTYGNVTSQVNTSEAAYRLLDKPSKTGRVNKDHSTSREILSDAVTVANLLGNRLFLKAEMASAEKQGETYRVTLADGRKIESKGLILAINDRVGTPRHLHWQGQESFKGQIRDGFSNDAKGLDWVGKKVVIVGMGAFATENLRTAVEAGAKKVTILARRHGTVCPKYIDYINFVNKSSKSSLSHDSVTNTRNMMSWRELYGMSGAKMPECSMKEIKHYGHTISVSDIWFVGHHLGIVDSLADEIDYFDENGLFTKETNSYLEADIVIRCTGFERNAQLVRKLTPYTQVNSCNYLDTNCMYLADALIDDNVFNSVFGSSVLEMARIFCGVFLHFWKSPDEYEKVKSQLKQVFVDDRKWSDYIGGLDTVRREVPGINAMAMKRIDQRRADFLAAHSVEEYIKENRREWQELHKNLGVWSDQTAYLPYPKWSAGEAASAAH